MKILALGATGAIGREMVAALGAAGHDISVTSRRAAPSQGNLRYVQGNAKDDTFLQSLLQQHWDVIVDFMVYDTPGFARRMQPLLQATDQYMFFSTARVFAGSDLPLDERSPRLLDVCQDQDYLATDEYALTKARQENALRASGRSNWTILRPYITFGEGRLQLGVLEKEAWLYRALRGRSIVFCKDLLETCTTLTEGSDVAAMAVALVGNPAALGQDFNLTGASALRWGEVLDLYSETLRNHAGKSPRIVLLTPEAFSESLRAPAQLYYDRIYNRRFNPAKIGKFYDLSRLTDPLSGMRDRIEAQLKNGRFLDRDWPMEAKRDQLAKERASLSEISGTRNKLRYLTYRYIPTTMIEMLRPK